MNQEETEYNDEGLPKIKQIENVSKTIIMNKTKAKEEI